GGGGVCASVMRGAMLYYVVPWLLALMYGPDEIATYAAANTVVGLAGNVFSGVTKGMEARMADAYQRGGTDDLRQSLKQTGRIAFSVLLSVVAAIFVTAPLLVALILPVGADAAAVVGRIPSLGFV